MNKSKAIIAGFTALTVTAAGMSSASATEPTGHLTQHIPGSTADSAIDGALPTFGEFADEVWAAYEWIRQHPQQLTITF